MKFGQLILRKIINIIATRCPTLRLKCDKIDFCWGFAPDSAAYGELTALPRPHSWNKGDLLPRENEGYREGKKRRGEGRGKERKERKGMEGLPCVSLNSP